MVCPPYYSAVVSAAILFGISCTSPAHADTDWTDGYYRITLYSGSTIDGYVTLHDKHTYDVEVKPGIVMTIQTAQVRQLEQIEPPPTAAPDEQHHVSDPRHRVSNEQIAQLLAGIEAKPSPIRDLVSPAALLPPLPLNEAAVIKMLDLVGISHDPNVPLAQHDHILLTDHFAIVYLSSRDTVHRLAARCEAVYDWNAMLMAILDLPVEQPHQKLQALFVEDFDDWTNYSSSHPPRIGPTRFSVYDPRRNLSQFFELETCARTLAREPAPRSEDSSWKKRQYYRSFRHDVSLLDELSWAPHTCHHIHFNTGLFDRRRFEQCTPLWLIKGTALLLEFTTPNGPEFPRPNQVRLYYLRQRHGTRPHDTASWRYFIADDVVWNGQDADHLAWALTYYLVSEHRQQFAAYLQVAGDSQREQPDSGPERLELFEKHFGKVNDAWITRFHDFLEDLKLDASTLPPELRN
jgi:hypothetical protein